VEWVQGWEGDRRGKERLDKYRTRMGREKVHEVEGKWEREGRRQRISATDFGYA